MILPQIAISLESSPSGENAVQAFFDCVSVYTTRPHQQDLHKLRDVLARLADQSINLSRFEEFFTQARGPVSNSQVYQPVAQHFGLRGVQATPQKLNNCQKQLCSNNANIVSLLCLSVHFRILSSV